MIPPEQLRTIITFGLFFLGLSYFIPFAQMCLKFYSEFLQ